MGVSRAALGIGLALGLPCCDPGPEPRRETTPAPAPRSPPEPEGLIRWAQRRADRDLQTFADWLPTALGSAPGQVNRPLSEWGHDVGYECAPGKPPPEDGFCSGAHRDASGWLARLSWKLDTPAIAAIEYGSYARHPLPCDLFGGTELGSTHTDAETGWITRVCRLEHALAVVEQMPFGEPYARTRINVYDDRFIELEPGTARVMRLVRKYGGF